MLSTKLSRAASCLRAAKLPPDLADPDVVPEWLAPEDAELYASGAATVPHAVELLERPIEIVHQVLCIPVGPPHKGGHVICWVAR